MNLLHVVPDRRRCLPFAAWLLLWPAAAPGQPAAPAPDLTGYRTVATAITAKVAPAARAAVGMPGWLGVVIEPNARGRLIVEAVEEGSAAAKCGLLPGDEIGAAAGRKVKRPEDLGTLLRGRAPGEQVVLDVKSKGRWRKVSATLGAPSRPMDANQSGAAQRAATDDPEPPVTRVTAGPGRPPFGKPAYRLAVVCVEYPDVKHNAQIAAKDWEEAFFSKATYAGKKNCTGDDVYGSLNDYYQEVSCGALGVEGKVFDWVTVSRNRMDYGQSASPASRGQLLTEALDEVLKRDGPDALKGFDGVLYIYAGARVRTNRGNLYWPHRSSVAYKGQRWSYFICPEGGAKIGNISVFAHEFGHMLGLPDLYARPENPGSEGLGVWCAMSQQLGSGRPQHFSAWCKERMGWLKPAVIDPTVKQKLLLSPIEGSPTECYKVLIRPDGSEYLLLENRRKQGFDTNLPGEGLLIWHVVGTRPILEESHGVEGPSGPRVFLPSVPYPSGANCSFTPYTVPSSRSLLGGGLPVSVTQVRRLPDGRVSFWIGYEEE